ncbi:MAG: EAL domain-containing protein, partial [Natronospirillum sp.]
MTKQVPASSTDPIAYFTLYDPLTGLPNRLLLHEHLSRAIGLARRHKQHVALLSLDLKEFKNRHSPSNIKMDEHELQMLGVFISSCIRASDTVCHLGDSQFVVLLTDIDKPEQSTQVANKLRTAFMDSLSEGGYRLDDTVRIVLSVYPGDGDDAEGLIQHAERALQAGRTAHNTDLYPGRTPYDGPLLSSRLQQAVDNGEFVLYYQPQFNLSTGSVIGAETFIRWLDPDRGLILPHQFMSVAESSGLIMTIGQWVLQQTCWQINAWKAIGMTPLPLSVNLSGEEFRNPHFVKNVAS